jgi:hypothetical protein
MCLKQNEENMLFYSVALYLHHLHIVITCNTSQVAYNFHLIKEKNIEEVIQAHLLIHSISVNMIYFCMYNRSKH